MVFGGAVFLVSAPQYVPQQPQDVEQPVVSRPFSHRILAGGLVFYLVRGYMAGTPVVP